MESQMDRDNKSEWKNVSWRDESIRISSYVYIVTQVARCCTRIFIEIIYFLKLHWLNARVIQFSISNKSSKIVFHGWMKRIDDVYKMLKD